MSTVLTNEDKIAIIDQKIRNEEYVSYSITLDLLAENAVVDKNTDRIADYNKTKTASQAKIAALTAAKTELAQKQDSMVDKAELIITALQQRIGEIVSNYETQIAILRAEITQMMQEKEDKIDAIQKYSDSLDLPLNGETN